LILIYLYSFSVTIYYKDEDGIVLVSRLLYILIEIDNISLTVNTICCISLLIM